MSDQIVQHYFKRNSIILSICKKCIRPFVHKVKTVKPKADTKIQAHSLSKFRPFLGQMCSEKSTLRQDHFASLYRIALRFIECVHIEYEILHSEEHSPADTIDWITELVQRLGKMGRINTCKKSPLTIAIDRYLLVYSSLRHEHGIEQRTAHLQTLQFLKNPSTDDLNFEKSVNNLLDHDRNRAMQDFPKEAKS